MKLYCMRHAQACETSDDTTRPLTERGRQEAEWVGQHLQACGVDVSHVVHSERARTTETAGIVAKLINPGLQLEPSEALTQAEDMTVILEELQHWTDDTLIVGHQPMMGELVSRLLAQDPYRIQVNFVPATIVCLERMQQSKWRLGWVINPGIVAHGE